MRRTTLGDRRRSGLDPAVTRSVAVVITPYPLVAIIAGAARPTSSRRHSSSLVISPLKVLVAARQTP